MERCPCHKTLPICPDAIGSSYSVARREMRCTVAISAADAPAGHLRNHPFAGGKRKPAQAKLKWRPRLTP